jgi:hypothetical protein
VADAEGGVQAPERERVPLRFPTTLNPTMDTVWKTALGRRFDAAIDQLEQALRSCPDELWQESLWEVRLEDVGVEPAAEAPALDAGSIQVYSAFWYLAYHTLFFLDLYLSGGLEQLDAGFAPPAPFRADEHDAGVLPKRVYARAELGAYLAHDRRKCQATIEALTDEEGRRPCRWGPREVPFFELLLVNLGHVREHSAQLGMLLGQRNVSSP